MTDPVAFKTFGAAKKLEASGRFTARQYQGGQRKFAPGLTNSTSQHDIQATTSASTVFKGAANKNVINLKMI